MWKLKVAILDKNMAVGKSKYMVTLDLHILTHATFRALDFKGSVDFALGI